jgi:hypothetical protein
MKMWMENFTAFELQALNSMEKRRKLCESSRMWAAGSIYYRDLVLSS